MLNIANNSKQQQDLFLALIRDYNAIYYVDLDTDSFSVLYANNVVNQEVPKKNFATKAFSKRMKDFTEQYVRDEDKSTLLKLTDCQYVKKRLEKENSYAFRYRVNPYNGLEFFEVSMAKPAEGVDENFAIMTVKNCNKQAREELAYQLEIEKRNTELNKALDTAKKAELSKADFFSRMSHDLRTPMNVILGLANLSADESNIEEMRKSIKRIHSAGNYLLGIINDSLDFQKIEAGGLKLEPELIRTKELIDDVTELAIQANKSKKVEVRILKKDVRDGAYLKVDFIRMKQIFVNLISNAIKFTPSGGTVEIKIEVIERKGNIVHDRITISDTGIGMSEDFLKNGIFKPFSQEHNEVVSSYAGTGLGLSISKQLLDLMGATIKVESELGTGTTFTVDVNFEVVDVESAQKIIKAKENNNSRFEPKLEGLKILLIEDHPLNAEIAERLLTKVGCQVTWAKNGKVGVDTFLESEPFYYDAVLMDIRMPIMNGLEASRAIRSLSRKDAPIIPIIAMTANAYREDIEASLAAGMNAHLAKPFNPHELYEEIGKWVSGKK